MTRTDPWAVAQRVTKHMRALEKPVWRACRLEGDRTVVVYVDGLVIGVELPVDLTEDADDVAFMVAARVIREIPQCGRDQQRVEVVRLDEE